MNCADIGTIDMDADGGPVRQSVTNLVNPFGPDRESLRGDATASPAPE
jgi:hypothetical protein